MTPQEMAERLNKREAYGLETPEIIELCFEVMEHHPDPKEQCRAAVILSGIVQKGLGKRTQEFIIENDKILPQRVWEILNASIMRMECF